MADGTISLLRTILWFVAAQQFIMVVGGFFFRSSKGRIQTKNKIASQNVDDA
jgi:hypothetical protein